MVASSEMLIYMEYVVFPGCLFLSLFILIKPWKWNGTFPFLAKGKMLVYLSHIWCFSHIVQPYWEQIMSTILYTWSRYNFTTELNNWRKLIFQKTSTLNTTWGSFTVISDITEVPIRMNRLLHLLHEGTEADRNQAYTAGPWWKQGDSVLITLTYVSVHSSMNISWSFIVSYQLQYVSDHSQNCR